MEKMSSKKFNLLNYLFLFLFQSCSLLTGNDTKTNKDKRADIYYSHGTSKLILKDYTNALKFLLKAKALRPNDTKILNNLAMTYYFKKDFKKSQESFLKALRANPENSDARNNLASLYFKRGFLKRAEKEYLRVLEDLIYPHQYRVHYNLALIYLKRGKVKSVLKHLKSSIAGKKDYCPAKFQLGELYFSQKLYQLAHKNFLEASKGTCYGEPAPHFKQALALEKLGKPQEALKKYELIIEKFPDSNFGKFAKKRSRNIVKSSFMKSTELLKIENKKDNLKAFKLFEDFENQKNTEIMTTSPRF
tara:strand:- start:499 stop:1410 length:912 start_codon:yes stop_codon:yes gene_type:complete